MAAVTMLHLPPALRTTLAIRFQGFFGVCIRPQSGLNSFQFTPRAHRALLDTQSLRRRYATVVGDSTQNLWDQHGREIVSGSAKTTGHREEVTESGGNAPAMQEATSQPQPAAPSERDRLLDVLHKRARKNPSPRRRRLRQHIQNALESAQPVQALRHLAYGNLEKVNTANAPPAESRSGSSSSVSTSDTAEQETIQLLDLAYLEKFKPLPTREEYPGALIKLFNAREVADAIHNGCGKLKLSMQTEVDFVQKAISKDSLKRLHLELGLQSIFVCTLKIDISNVFQGNATGEGISKQAAKQAAWLHLVSKMHVDGALTDLFPAPVEQARVARQEAVHHGLKQSGTEALELPEDNHLAASSEPVEVDEQTMEQEKDAKTEIYNYAAGLGAYPHFEIKCIQPRTPRARRGQMPRKPKAVFRVSIRLDGQGIHVSATGKDARTAEVAAAVAFKKQAQQQYLSSNGMDSPPPQTSFGVLSVDTAYQFFEFYRDRVRGLDLEIEHEAVQGVGNTQNCATLTIDGKPVGQKGTMRTKKEAESVAYLTAAVEITKANPHLLHEFQETLKKGKGQVLRPLNSVDLQIYYGAIQTMRKALVEARDAGLPDSRQALGAETPGVTETYSHRRHLTPHELEAANDLLLKRQLAFETDRELQELRAKKSMLPMNTYCDHVLGMVSDNLYSIVVGATGSGKTTQVPQILFEDAIAKNHGGSCNIICTQPRRIAATSVAQRVAVERNEKLRTTVGYQVRFDAKLPYQPYGITYCTTGILLEKLKHNPDEVLDSASHLIIDEVHERDLNVDFLMIVLKRAIQIRRNDGKPVPKIILMSATLDVKLFEQYFQDADRDGVSKPCPSLSVPGRMFPVKEKYLGSIMQELLEKRGSYVRALLKDDPRTRDYMEVETAFSASQSGTKRSEPESGIDWRRERQPELDSTDDVSVAREKEEALVPVELLVATIAHICDTTKDGAVLAFLPGLEEILRAQEQLFEGRLFGLDFKDDSKFQVCLLHSSVPQAQQAEIFDPSPPGCRKIILSTNIAETSVTVPEVKFVVDTGKLREKRYDQLRRITKLQCVWESRSNAKQRAGRAGRVQDGHYYALFSKERYDSFRAIGLPELLRSDLQTTCLDIKAQKFSEPVASFLAQAIEPPSKKAVSAAIENLIAIEAFTVNEELTALGRLLSRLQVHPSLGKMITLGVLFRCLDPMIILGVAAEERSILLTPVGLRAEATRAHHSYAGDSQSDHIAILKAFDELRLVRNQYGPNATFQRAREGFLHMGAFRVIDQIARQIEGTLEESGLIRGDKLDGSQYGPAELNRNANNHELIKCLLVAGFHPNLAVKLTSQGVVYRTPSEQTVLQHPASLNAEMKTSNKHPYGSLFVYSTLNRSNDNNTLFLRNSTLVTPLSTLLFGGQLCMTENGRLEMDDWLPIFVKSHDRQFATKLILEFRKALDRILNTAFNSLSHRDAESKANFANDPVREKFVERVVEVLKHTSAMQYG